MASSELEDKDGTTIVMYGDTPLLKSAMVDAMLNHHEVLKQRHDALLMPKILMLMEEL